ncbi:hypothetical protein CLU79DRAFT_750151, partial [Phycomyces nitens]
ARARLIIIKKETMCALQVTKRIACETPTIVELKGFLSIVLHPRIMGLHMYTYLQGSQTL